MIYTCARFDVATSLIMIQFHWVVTPGVRLLISDVSKTERLCVHGSRSLILHCLDPWKCRRYASQKRR